jgi:hypothetical protein
MPGLQDDLLADVIFASTGIEPEITARAEPYEIMPGLFVPLATKAHLLAMKVLALRKDRPQDRPQDFTDIRELLKVSSDEDVKQARAALELISRRGYDQGRDLLSDFEEQLLQFKTGRE